MSKMLIFIPTYNESGNVRQMSEQITALGLDADLVFMDDNSPDGTGQILDELAQKYPRMRVIHRAGKQGIGTAHMAGIAYAYDHGYDVLVTLDCDFTHSPADIPLLLRHSADAVITVGSRFLEKDSLPGWSFIRKSLTIFGHALTKYLLGISQDATGAFRVYRLDKIDRAMFGLIASRGYSFFFESLFIAHQNGLTIKDVPIVLPARTYGESKMQMTDIRASVEQLVTLSVTNRVYPSRFQLGRGGIEVDPHVRDPQGWDRYWEKKQSPEALAYELVAGAYRSLAMKSRLENLIHQELPAGAALLHAGCGSGMVDVDLHGYAKITAVDVSVPALRMYQHENPNAHAIRHASVLDLPFADGTFDGAYTLGLLEHFERQDLVRAISEIHRVLRPGGKLIVFWPHVAGASVKVLNGLHWAFNDVLKKDIHLHPPEFSLLRSKEHAEELLRAGGFALRSFEFGPRDLFIQAVVVAERT